MITRFPPAAAERRLAPRRSTKALTAVLILALASAGGGGCTTTTSLHPQTAARENALASVPVTVVTNDGRNIDMEVSESSADHLVGTDREGRSHTILLQDIRSLHITRFSPGKTAGLTLGIAAVATSIALLAYATSGFPAVTL